jgi:uncharacterized membrane protein (DUF4010 family)
MLDLEAYEPYLALGLALAVGLLIGVERERTRPRKGEDDASFFGGVRTFPIFSMLGGIATLLSSTLGPWPFVLATLTTGTLVAMSYRRDLERKHHGLTSEGAFLAAYFLGALTTAKGTLEPFSTRALTVIAMAVVVTLLLSAKAPLHRWVSKMSEDDLIAVVKLLIVGTVVLPQLPDHGYGPWQALNPFSIGKMVALIAAVGFAGWLGTRVLGPGRGMLVTGAVGGLVSSTAVTLAAAGRAKEQPRLADLSAVATLLASTLMVARVAVVAGAVHLALLESLAAPLAGMLVGGAAWSLYLYKKSKPGEGSEALQVANPFELSSALKFAALFTAVLLISRAGLEWFGERATYVTGLLAGTTDVDAITLSMAQLAGKGQISDLAAGVTVFLAAVSNTIVKAGMTLVVGGRDYARKTVPGFAAMLVLGGLAALGQRLVTR